MRKLVLLALFVLAASAQTLTLKTSVAVKPDADHYTIPNVTVTTPGDSLLIFLAYDPVGITSATWGGQPVFNLTGAVNCGKGGRQYSSGARTMTYMVQNVSGTADLAFTFSRDSYGFVAAVFETDAHWPDQAAAGAPSGCWAGPTANPATGLSYFPTQNVSDLLVAALSTEGPPSDAPGTWQQGFTEIWRGGTTGGSATDNMTLSVAVHSVSAIGQYSASKSGITPRYWAISLGSVY